MPLSKVQVDFLLFDLDGTLVNSTPAVEKTWIQQCDNHNLKQTIPIDSRTLLDSAHGSRTSETIKKWFPYMASDDESINNFERDIVTNYGHLAKEVHGASTLLDSINKLDDNKWAIITSGTRDLAHGWFEKIFTKIAKPAVFVTANDVSHGKPNPEGYLKGFSALKELNGPNREYTAVVFEDAPVGTKAGVAAGFEVIGIATTFGKDTLVKAGATYVVKDLSDVSISTDTPGAYKLSLNTL